MTLNPTEIIRVLNILDEHELSRIDSKDILSYEIASINPFIDSIDDDPGVCISVVEQGYIGKWSKFYFVANKSNKIKDSNQYTVYTAEVSNDKQ